MRTGCGGGWAGLSEAPHWLARAGLAARFPPLLCGCLRSARQGVLSPRPADRSQNAPSGPILMARSPQRPVVSQACQPAEPNPVPHRPQKAFLHRASPDIRSLDRGSTRTQLGPLRGPVRRLHSVCRLRILSSHSPSGPLHSKRPYGASTPQASPQTSLRQRPGSSDCRAPAAARRRRLPAAPFSLGAFLQAARHHLTPVPNGACGPQVACLPRPVSRAGCLGQGKMF